MPTSLAASTTPCQIRTLPNGHLLMVWNQQSEEEAKRGYVRMRLSSAISRNGGSVWEFFQNIESAFETTRVEPGPIRLHKPEESHWEPGWPAPGRDGRMIEPLPNVNIQGRWSYPSVVVAGDRVLVAHSYTTYDDDPDLATLVMAGGSGSKAWHKKGAFNQKLRVFPIEWFYGGKEPADNPFLKRAHEAAVP